MYTHIISIVFLTLLFLWIWKSIVIREEGWHKNILRFGRYHRTISGVRNRVPDKDGNLVSGRNTLKFAFILYGIDRVSRYKFGWVESRESGGISLEDQNLVWGNPQKDAQISYQRTEWTNRHKDQHDYHFRINALETGESSELNIPIGTKDNPQNVKIDSALMATVLMENPYKAEFRSEAGWYKSLDAVLRGTLGEVIACRKYGQLGDIRGEKISEVEVKNTEPLVASKMINETTQTFHFADTQGKRLEKVTFIQRINYEIGVVKDQGVSLKNVTLLDYDVSEESKGYVKALQDLAVSEVNLQKADNEAQALEKTLGVKKVFIKDVITTNKQAQIELRNTLDKTAVQKAEKLQNLRVYIESGGPSNITQPVDVNKLIETSLSMDIINETKDGTPPSETKQHSSHKKHNRK